MRNTSDSSPPDLARTGRKPARNVSPTPVRYRAVSMQLAAYLDGRYVEMHVLTETGQTIDIICEKNSIFSVQRHIEEIGRACPEISNWKPAKDQSRLHGNDRRSYEAAMWEGWPAPQQPAAGL